MALGLLIMIIAVIELAVAYYLLSGDRLLCAGMGGLGLFLLGLAVGVRWANKLYKTSRIGEK